MVLLENYARMRVPEITSSAALTRKKIALVSATAKSPLTIITKPRLLNKDSSSNPGKHKITDNTHEQNIFSMTSEIISARLRREHNRLTPPEEVATTAEEDRHDRPAELADQAIHIKTSLGNGWVPIEASLDLEIDDLSQVEEIYFVHHGVKRNAKEYFQFMKKALGKEFDPRKTLIIATQFTNVIDLKEENGSWKKHLWKGKYNGEEGVVAKHVLNWGFNDYRGAEPAQNPNAPIDSFTAMDAVIEQVLEKTKNAGANVQALRFRGNSEGAQMLIRYLAFSKYLKKLERDKHFDKNEWKPKMEIEGFASNPGTVLYFDRRRPLLLNRFENYELWKFNWIIPNNPEVNIWPFGLDNPPPYIKEYLNEYAPEVASSDLMRRCVLGIGTNDKKYDGSQLPTGPGLAYAAQGLTRLERVEAYHSYLQQLDKKRALNMQIVEAIGIPHDGAAMLDYYQKLQRLKRFNLRIFGESMPVPK